MKEAEVLQTDETFIVIRKKYLPDNMFKIVILQLLRDSHHTTSVKMYVCQLFFRKRLLSE